MREVPFFHRRGERVALPNQLFKPETLLAYSASGEVHSGSTGRPAMGAPGPKSFRIGVPMTFKGIMRRASLAHGKGHLMPPYVRRPEATASLASMVLPKLQQYRPLFGAVYH